MRSVLDIARSRIAQHEHEIARLRDLLRVAEELTDSGATTPTKEILAAAADYLAETPATAAEIYQDLVRLGIRVPGKSPKGNLTAKFAARKDVFQCDPKTRIWSIIPGSRL